MSGSKRRFITRISICLVGFAVLIAGINLYMNLMLTYSLPSMQLDISADGDLFGFHEVEHEDDGHIQKPHGNRDESGCLGLCPAPESSYNQESYVTIMMDRRLQTSNLRPPPAIVQGESFEFQSGGPKWHFDSKQIKALWTELGRWKTFRSIWPNAYSNWSAVLQGIESAKILNARAPQRGVQVKAVLKLEGGQIAYFKPKTYALSDVINESIVAGRDRHNGEIAAFHLARLLGLPRTPIAVGRRLDLKRDVFRVADSSFIDSFFFEGEERLCFYRKGKCQYCNKAFSVCAESGTNSLDGALIPLLPFELGKTYKHPWARSYKAETLAPWQINPNYCSSVKAQAYYGDYPLFLDFIDTAIFDFLIGNGDRHSFETPKKEPFLIILDNGKSFGDPYSDELSILAPLYQCCEIRKRFYDALHYYTGNHVNLASVLDKELTQDPLYPILSSEHLNAINRRLVKALTIVELCIERHGRDKVVKTSE